MANPTNQPGAGGNQSPNLEQLLDSLGSFLSLLALFVAGSQNRQALTRAWTYLRQGGSVNASRVYTFLWNAVVRLRRLSQRLFLIFLITHVVMMLGVSIQFKTIPDGFWSEWIICVGVVLLGFVLLFVYAMAVQMITNRQAAAQAAAAAVGGTAFNPDAFYAQFGPRRSPLFMFTAIVVLTLGLSWVDFNAYFNLCNGNDYYTMWPQACWIAFIAFGIGFIGVVLPRVIVLALGIPIQKIGGFVARLFNAILRSVLTTLLVGVTSQNAEEQLKGLGLDLEGFGRAVSEAMNTPTVGAMALGLFWIAIPVYAVRWILLVLFLGAWGWEFIKRDSKFDPQKLLEERQNRIRLMESVWQSALIVAVVYFAISALSSVTGLDALWKSLMCDGWSRILSFTFVVLVPCAAFIALAVVLRAHRLAAVPFGAVGAVFLILFAMGLLATGFKLTGRYPKFVMTNQCPAAATPTPAPAAPVAQTPPKPRASRHHGRSSASGSTAPATNTFQCPGQPWFKTRETCRELGGVNI
ncbi:MAG TPA: hypothetical protein VFQ60_05005 [Patescibacteria group bacterium]|nr:hypothetical protein [Patescibacteria group bacterium]